MIAKQVFYSGQVQGVGFRYSTVRIAEDFEVAGWVCNLPDGRVELQVKGEPDQVVAFLMRIREQSHLADNIRNADERELPIELLDGVCRFSIRKASLR